MSIRPGDRRARFEGNYRAGRSREASKRKNYLFIGADRGQYRWEDLNGDNIRDQDEFIPDSHGSYYLYEETLSDYRPVNIVSTNGRLTLETPERLLGGLIGKPLAVRSETSFDITEKSIAPTSDVFLLKLNRFRKTGKTVTGDSRLQEDLTMPFAEGAGNVRLRYFRYDALNAEYVTGAERHRQEEQSLRVRIPVTSRYDTEFTFTRAFWDRTMEKRAAGDYRVASHSSDASVSFYPSLQTKLGVTAGGGLDKDSLSGLKAVFWQAVPSAAYRFGGKGRLEATYTMTAVSFNRPVSDAAIPYPMARSQKEGMNHDISIVCDYRLSTRMNLIATYTGRKFGGREFEHFARTQVRAMF